MSMTEAMRVLAARTALVLHQPFFGALALKLQLVEDPACKTLWTDGRSLGFNPSFVATLSQAELVGGVGHEVMHCAMGHPWRRGGREMRRWNEACDLALNPILQRAGFTLPKGALIDPQFDGKSAEWVHDRLPNQDGGEQEGGQGGKGNDQQGSGSQAAQPGQDDQSGGQDAGGGRPDSSGIGEVRDAPADGAEDGTTEGDWQQAVQQAAQAAKKRGSLPGGLERFVKEAVAPRVDWRSALWRFVQERAQADYSWNMPNVRYIPAGLYLPSLRSDEMGELVWGFDTSGSVDEVLIGQWRNEIQAVVEDLKPRRVHVIYCDAKVHRVDTFERGDPIELRPLGGGGTSFVPVFEKLEELGIEPACLVYLTDLEGSFPKEAPPYPVLWATTQPELAVPFGEKVRCS